MDDAALKYEISTLPDHLKDEVADFVGYLKQKFHKIMEENNGKLSQTAMEQSTLKIASGLPAKNEVTEGKNSPFTVFHVDNRNYKFNRDEANER